MKQIMNQINIELEIKRLARAFAEQQNIRIEVLFNRPLGDKFNEEWYRHRGFCDSKTVPGLHQTYLHRIYIKLARDNRSLIFRTLAHELAHAWRQETEGKNCSKKHNLAFWKTFDDYTLPFMLDNLSGEDKERLDNLLNPTTNQDEEWDRVYLETKEGIISFPVAEEDIDQQWKAIRQETIKGNLGKEARVSTKRISQDKYQVSIYIADSQNKAEIARIREKLVELGISETDIKVR